jgi:hypothetical protein
VALDLAAYFEAVGKIVEVSEIFSKFLRRVEWAGASAKQNRQLSKGFACARVIRHAEAQRANMFEV